MALNIQTFIKRTLTAIVFVAILLFGICYNYISFVSLFFVVSIWGLNEFYLLAEKLNVKPYKIIGYLAGISLFLFSSLSQFTLLQGFDFLKNILPFSFVLIFLVFFMALFYKYPNPIQNIAYTILGVIYVVLPFSLLVHISCIDNFFIDKVNNQGIQSYAPYNYHYVLGVIVLIWISDVSAYLVGSFFGKHKLCGCFAKVIVRHQRKFNNNPIGFVSFEYTSGDKLHFHSIWSELVNIDEIDNIFEVSNVQNNLLSGDNVMEGWGYRAIDKQVCGYIPKNKYGSDWLGYITKKNNIFVYYTPSLIKEIKGANVAIEKINDQNGLVDNRNIHLFKYLSKQRLILMLSVGMRKHD